VLHVYTCVRAELCTCAKGCPPWLWFTCLRLCMPACCKKETKKVHELLHKCLLTPCHTNLHVPGHTSLHSGRTLHLFECCADALTALFPRTDRCHHCGPHSRAVQADLQCCRAFPGHSAWTHPAAACGRHVSRAAAAAAAAAAVGTPGGCGDFSACCRRLGCSQAQVPPAGAIAHPTPLPLTALAARSLWSFS